MNPVNLDYSKFAQLRKKASAYNKHYYSFFGKQQSFSPDTKIEEPSPCDAQISNSKQKGVNISVHMPISTQIIIGNEANPNIQLNDTTIIYRRRLHRNYSQYEKNPNNKKHLKASPKNIIQAYMALGNIKKRMRAGQPNFNSRDSIMLEKDSIPNKSISQLKLRLPSVAKKRHNDVNYRNELVKKGATAVKLVHRRQHQSYSILPLTSNKNISIEGRQIYGDHTSNYTNNIMHVKRKSILIPEYASLNSRNPNAGNKSSIEAKIICPSIDIEELYSTVRVGKEEWLRLLPKLFIKEPPTILVAPAHKYQLESDLII
jgi:hypothetical protein